MALTATPQQRSFDDIGQALAEVTFVVVDLETTGGSPVTDAITEIGAVKVRGGEILATFQTLVNPGVPIPPSITFLTGITEAMTMPAPRVEEVLGALVGFVGGNVIVGHNVRFDLGFLGAAMQRHQWPRLTNVVVDTCALARRLVRDEVPNCKLATLAQHFRVTHRPTHRALDDAWATTEVLHGLLERAGSLGVLGLDDLVGLPTVGAHPQLGKLTLTNRLPRRPGVYVFRDAGHRPLYVGKAVDLRRRVRSYFTSDDRRKVGGLLREMAAIDHVECSSELEASVLEVRMIHALSPRYNRRTKHWRAYSYLKLTLDEAWPRLSVVRVSRPGDGCLYLGPLGSARTARQIADAIETVVPLRRCAARLGAAVAEGSAAVGRRDGPCAPAQLGVATCPCSGESRPPDLPRGGSQVGRGPDRRPHAAADSPAGAAPPPRHPAALRGGRPPARQGGGAGSSTRAPASPRRPATGRADGARGHGGGMGSHRSRRAVRRRAQVTDGSPAAHRPWRRERGGAPGEPVPRHLVDEVATIAAWLEARAGEVRVTTCEGGLAWPAARLTSFEPSHDPPRLRR